MSEESTERTDDEYVIYAHSWEWTWPKRALVAFTVLVWLYAFAHLLFGVSL